MFFSKENIEETINYDSKIAVVLYGDNIDSELISQSLEKCYEKFKSYTDITYFYEVTNTSIWNNLYQVAFKKRKFEIDRKNEFNYIISINVQKIKVMNMVSFNNSKCSEFSLYYFLGFYNKASFKTSITDAGFYCTSRIFDLVSNYVNVKEKIEKLACDDKAFGDNSQEHQFYYYLKTLNLKTYCATPLLFEEIKQ
jgi:hypothetical protein